MEKSTLTVIIVDDDGLGVRKSVFEQYFQLEALRLKKELIIRIYVKFPCLSAFKDADIISWDNDLGVDTETIRHIRKHQYIDANKVFDLFKDKVHVIHSMNGVAADGLYMLFTRDFYAETYKVSFIDMKRLVESLM